ncbi:MAG: PLP-dependent transferase [Phycisphaerales bacterium]|nr:PLP-dependent transferase [Phycisphaerales bacterium]
MDSSDPENVRKALRPNTKLIFIESPANPTMKLTDVEAVAKIGKAAGVKVAVDNTFLTPVIQRPRSGRRRLRLLDDQAHRGHSTAVGGSVVSRDAELLARVRFIRKCTGGIQAAFQAWLTVRGVKTLPRASSSLRQRLAVAKALA